MLDVNVLKFLRGCATETEQSPQCVIQNLQLANLSYPLKSPSDQLPRKKLNNNCAIWITFPNFCSLTSFISIFSLLQTSSCSHMKENFSWCGFLENGIQSSDNQMPSGRGTSEFQMRRTSFIGIICQVNCKCLGIWYILFVHKFRLLWSFMIYNWKYLPTDPVS